MNGRLISVSIICESSILAFSAASFSRCSAILSLLRSMLFFFLNSSISQSTMRWSTSSPPRCVSPLVDFTSTTPAPTSSTEISNVPPPRSYTAIVSSLFLSNPYASAAAVGSLMMRTTSRPAISPAHEPLDRIHRVLGIRHRLPLRHLPDQPLAGLGDRHDGRRRPRTLLVGDHHRLPALHHRHHRVRCSQVNSNNLAHCCR